MRHTVRKATTAVDCNRLRDLQVKHMCRETYPKLAILHHLCETKFSQIPTNRTNDKKVAQVAIETQT